MLSIALCPAGCNMEGQSYQFDMAGGSFGRAPDNNWVLPDPSRYVSSRHGSIYFENNQFLLLDESTNGIYLNGGNLPLGSAQPAVLNNGDLLVFGDYRLQVNIEETTNIPPQESTKKVSDASAASPKDAANPVFVDDLDKWLEPSTPQSELNAVSKTKINISSSPLVQPLDSVDLGLKGEEKDPLALLGVVQPKSDAQKAGAAGSLTDLLGDTPSLDQQMMKVPNVIPDDWDELLGGRAADQSDLGSHEPIQLTPSSVQNATIEPKSLDLDETACLEPETPNETTTDLGAVQNEVDEKLSEPRPKPPEILGLSELLATPPELLQPEIKASADNQNLSSELEASTPVSSPVSREKLKPDNVEKTNTSVSHEGNSLALAKALGLERLSTAQQEVLNETVANTVKETVSGMMRTLRTRSEIKSEFRMNMTTIQSAENNPLKFSVTPEDAIENMFAKEGKAYLSPIDAMNDGFADISEHQVALFDAMRAAYEHILGQFDPGALAQKFEKTSSKRFLGSGKGKNWDAYLALFEEYKEDNELTFKRLFGDVFADAYERRMHSLKMNRNSSANNKPGE